MPSFAARYREPTAVHGVVAADRGQASVFAVCDAFDAFDASIRQEIQLRVPRVGRAVGQFESVLREGRRFGCLAQTAGLEAVLFQEKGIEPTQTSKARRHRYVDNGHLRIGQEPFREQQALRLRVIDRRHAELRGEHAAQVPIGDAEVGGQRVQVCVGQIAVFDARRRLREPRRRIDACIARRQFRKAQARPVPACSCRGAGKNAVPLRRFDGTYGPTVDARRGNTDEELPVETRVVGQKAVTLIVLSSMGIVAHLERKDSPFSDIVFLIWEIWEVWRLWRYSPTPDFIWILF